VTGLREQKKQQTHDAIVAEAGRLFGEQGFQATTMEEIAQAAGVSAGTLYNYFGTKNTIVLAHIGAEVAEMVEKGAAIVDGPPADVIVAVQKLTRVHLDRFVGMDRELLREMLSASFGPASNLLPELIRLDYLLLDQLSSLLQHFADTGDLDPAVDSAEAAIAVYSLLATQLIMYLSVEDMSAAALRRAAARQIQIVFTGLRAQER
jgi:AcrR family transcriptional regulator